MALVQTATAQGALTATTSFPGATTPGNLLVAAATIRNNGGTVVMQAGWTQVASVNASGTLGARMWYRTADGTETSVALATTSHVRLTLAEFEREGTLVDQVALSNQSAATSYPVGAADLPADGVLVGIHAHDDTGGGPTVVMTDDASFTRLAAGMSNAFAPYQLTSYREAGPGAYTETPTSGKSSPWAAILAAFTIQPVFTADFTAVPTVGDVPLPVAFVDTSFGGTGTVDTWAWDFGDGFGSTVPDPIHVYYEPGVYTVSLTVETDDAETDTLTRVELVTVTPVHVPPLPANAIIEIRAAAPGSDRWGSATWGSPSVWSTAGWRDVTPQSIDATVRWGSHAPEAGILAEAEAASWILNTFDPERLLDPGNPDSPYAADLRAGLPIRIRHRGTIIRQGVAETIAYFHANTVGGIRVTDNLSILARTQVPEDITLADKLRARARDAIAGAGLAITVEGDPPSRLGGDPDILPQTFQARSVWRWIADAAEQVLHIAYVDRIGTVRFRAWAYPYDRDRVIDETNLVELGAIAQTRGLYSVVQTLDDADVEVERVLTPTPRYGRVVYRRDDPTPDAGAWADAVLADRGPQTVQWIPGDIHPLTADDVEYFALFEGFERIRIEHTLATPPVSVEGIIVGGELRLRSKRDSEALWSFSFELAQTESV